MNDYGGLDETGKSYSVLPTARRTTRPHAGLRLEVLADATSVQKRPVSSDLSAF
jgi:hypothetical protein